MRRCRSVLLPAYSWRICTGCSDLGYRMPVVTAMVSAGSPHWLLSPGRDILFIFIFNSSNEWWRWPRQSGRAHKDKSLFHTAASIYWCCPQHDGSLANASLWWHWGCFWFFIWATHQGKTVKLCLCTFLCLSACSYVSFSWFLPSLSVGADPANFGGHPSHLRFRTEENLSLLTSLKHLLLRMDAPWRPRSVLPGDLSVLSIIGQGV